ncbi:MAG: MnhB domain-containing protein [Clostridia bacterium]|nr:MnhB domain-containing protein [Clostridia bacterium]
MIFSKILITISRIILPFLLMFGIYIILNGDISVGGGFQGGVIIATSYLLYYFIKGQHPFSLSKMLKIDKYLFIFLPVMVLISYFTRGYFFTNWFDLTYAYEIRRLFLVLLNLVIGLKVAIGFVSLFVVFIEEGNS